MAPNLPRRKPPRKHMVTLILIFTSRGSSCYIYMTIETVYRKPSWYKLETSPWEEQSHCSTMSSRKHPSESLKNNPGCLLPARQQGPACKRLQRPGSVRGSRSCPGCRTLGPPLGHQAQLPSAFLPLQHKLFPALTLAVGPAPNLCNKPQGRRRRETQLGCLHPAKLLYLLGHSVTGGEDRPNTQLMGVAEPPWSGRWLCLSQQPRDGAALTAAFRGGGSPQRLVTFYRCHPRGEVPHHTLLLLCSPLLLVANAAQPSP